MSRLLAVTLLAATLTAQVAQACSVFIPVNREALTERADLIVRGTITGYEVIERQKDGAVAHARMTVAVDQTLKGEPRDEVVVVWVDEMGMPAQSPWSESVIIGTHALTEIARRNFDAEYAVMGGICSMPFVIESE